MHKSEIRLNYQQATQLINVGRYDEALETLVELNEAKPNTENILYLMAVCQAKAGHNNDAQELCNRLIQEFDHERAKELLKHLGVAAASSGRLRKKSRHPVEERTASGSESHTVEDEGQQKEPLVEDLLPEPELSEIEGDAEGAAVEATNDVIHESGVNHEEADVTIKAVPEEEQQESPRQTKETSTEVTVSDVNESEEGVPVTRRPLWLILLWAATGALIVASILYIYVLDERLNPY